MSNYTTPTTRADDELITTSAWNTDLTENIKYLHNPPSNAYRASGANYTTTNTSFTNVDGTNLALSLTVDATTDVQIVFAGACSGAVNGNSLFFDVLYDGTSLGQSQGLAYTKIQDSNDIQMAMINYLQTGVPSGTHTYTLQWKVAGTTPTGTLIQNQARSYFWVKKI